MASSEMQLLGFLLSLAGLGATAVAACMVEWRRFDEGSGLLQQTYEGLWMTCTGQIGGRMTCESYESLFKLPIEIQATRSVMLLSIFLSGVALMASTAGMKCTRFMDGNDRTKATVAMVGGIIFMISGVLTLAITSWYVQQIIQSFFGSRHLTRYEFGNAVFVSWGGAVSTLVGGAFLSCRRCSRSLLFRPSSTPGTDYV
ncbi:claudin-1-like [Lampris incognitus]|uniref:claudin-1-like n=1 Tax=Lampris incognitus TaxID=2546036 RepID=UPI0024B5F799|nr:claudin-1-like [Lampris incognitus]